jgi:hypothetical protein
MKPALAEYISSVSADCSETLPSKAHPLQPELIRPEDSRLSHLRLLPSVFQAGPREPLLYYYLRDPV